jgi:hypothetical protein
MKSVDSNKNKKKNNSVDDGEANTIKSKALAKKKYKKPVPKKNKSELKPKEKSKNISGNKVELPNKKKNNSVDDGEANTIKSKALAKKKYKKPVPKKNKSELKPKEKSRIISGNKTESPNKNKTKIKKIVKTNVKSKLSIPDKNDTSDAKKVENNHQKKDKNVFSNEDSKPEELDDNNSNELEFNSNIIFFNDEHLSAAKQIITQLKSEDPYSFISSMNDSYAKYYKEIIINHLKNVEKIKLIYFDPEFGTNLVTLINKEIIKITITDIESSIQTNERKILVIDNENIMESLDWDLVDIIQKELKISNIGFISILPNSFVNEITKGNRKFISKFKIFDFPPISQSDKLDFDSKRSDQSNLDEILMPFCRIDSLSDKLESNSELAHEIGIWSKVWKKLSKK